MDTVKIKAKGVKMIAHRGLSGIERENTYPAFVAAANRSYYGIETDVHKTADGHFVIIHDDTTDRVSAGEWKLDVEKSKYDQLKAVILPDFDGSTNRQDIRIPLLKDYIKICRKYNKMCILELKNAFEETDIKKMVEEIRKLEYLDHVIFISFVLENCRMLRRMLPENDIQWLIGREATEEIIQTLIAQNLNLDIQYQQLTQPLVDRLHGQGIKVNCWTCDNAEEAEQLAGMGVDFITSNILE